MAVVMLNLLRFVDGGQVGYREYLAHFRPHGDAVGAKVIYYGEGGGPIIAEPGQAWDAVLIVAYPSRQAFADMLRNPEYQAGTHLRTQSLVEAILQPTVPYEVEMGA